MAKNSSVSIWSPKSKRKGKAKKKYGPKTQRPKKYRGQGR